MIISNKQYTEAFYDAIKSNTQLEKLIMELEIILDNFAKIENILHNPKNNLSQIQQILAQNNISEPIINLLAILTANNDLKKLPMIFSGLKQKINAINKISEAKITLAKDINDQELNNIQKLLENVLGTKLTIKKNIDAKILGGIIVQIDTNLFDASLINSLTTLQKKLTI